MQKPRGTFIPTGLENLLAMLAANPEFAATFFSDRQGVIAASGISLTPTERRLAEVTSDQDMQRMVGNMRGSMPDLRRRSFLKYSTAILAALSSGGVARLALAERREKREDQTTTGARPMREVRVVRFRFLAQNGPLPSNDIKTVFEDKTDSDLLLCYEKFAKLDKQLQGSFPMRVSIAESGVVTKTKLYPTTFDDPGVGKCMAAMVAKWTFPKVEKDLGPTWVLVELSLKIEYD